ncbi:MAG: hypothetical protein WCZ89_08115 [Phycisphaerae bacterium]
MKTSTKRWLILTFALALLIIIATPQPTGALVCRNVYLNEEGGDGEDANEPQPESSLDGFGGQWLDDDGEGEPQPEIAFGNPGMNRLDDEEPNEPEPDEDPNEPQPESC